MSAVAQPLRRTNDLAALRCEWQACLVNSRQALAALALAEERYVAAHQAKYPARRPTFAEIKELGRGGMVKTRIRRAHNADSSYPGAD